MLPERKLIAEIKALWIESRDDGIVVAQIIEILQKPEKIPLRKGNKIYIVNQTGGYQTLCRRNLPGTAFQGIIFFNKKNLKSRKKPLHVLVMCPINTNDLYIEITPVIV